MSVSARNFAALSRIQRQRCGIAALIILLTASASLLAVQSAAKGAGVDTAPAVAALEACLQEHRKAPAKCTRVAEPFCADLRGAECRRFEISAWRRLAARASNRLAIATGAKADQEFVEDAAEDTRALRDAVCDAAAAKAAEADSEKIRLDCLLHRFAAHGSALWLVAGGV